MTRPIIRRYRRRPVEVEAVQVAGSDDGQTARDIAAWCRGSLSGTYRQPTVILDEGAAHVGEWIVRCGDSRYQIVGDDDMRADHEEIDPT